MITCCQKVKPRHAMTIARPNLAVMACEGLRLTSKKCVRHDSP